MRSLRTLVQWVAALITLTGIVGCDEGGIPTSERAAEARTAPVAPEPRVIVATGGGGVNIYHEIFRQGGPIYGERAPSSVTPALLAELGIGPEQIIDVTRTGNPEADYAADRERLNATPVGQPHWIRGTNLIIYPGPSLDDGAHFVSLNPFSLSTRATSDIFLANPEAVVLFFESGRPGEAYEDAVFNDLVDVHGIYGPSFPIGPSILVYVNAYNAVTMHGKLLIDSVDATKPFPHQLDFGPGTWWSIAIGYFDEGGTNGKDPRTPALPDYSADHTLLTPAYCSFCQSGYQDGDGTGGVSTYAAGVVSAVILELRRRLGHRGGTQEDPATGESVLVLGPAGVAISNWDIRRALEEVSAVPGVLDYDPTGVLRANSISVQPSVEQAPWASLGWGLLSPVMVNAAVDYLLAMHGIGPPAERLKSFEHCQIMLASMEVRITWSEEFRRLYISEQADQPSRVGMYQRCDS